MKHEMWTQDSFVISCDPAWLDEKRIHSNLTTSYWSPGIPLQIVQKSIRHSLNFGIYTLGQDQIGFARIMSDFATFAYLADVYVEKEFRSQGLSKWLMKCIMSHPELQGLRRFCLGTRDAHGLYKQFGFEVIKDPEKFMEIKISDFYLK